jgi:hypothetical protein
VDRVERFFAAAGLKVERVREGFQIAGRLFPLANVWSATTFVDWSSRIDRFVATQMPERLERATVRLAELPGDYTISRSPVGVSIEQGGEVVATIRATSASLARGRQLVGNFLAAGNVWKRLRDELEFVATNEDDIQVIVPGDERTFFTGVEQIIGSTYGREPRLPDRRDDYPWVTGYLGDPFASVWFIAESPSLSRVEAAARTPQTMEMQWSVSPGDKLFRRMLSKHGFKRGDPFEPGGWRCYITDVIKSSYRVKDWQKTADEVRLAVAEVWAPVLRFELEHGHPKLLVVLGRKTLTPLEHLVRKRLLPPLPETITIYHYSYIGSRPQGKLGPLHPDRIAAWDADFARIAARALTLG